MKRWMSCLGLVLGVGFTCGAMPLSPEEFRLPNQDQPAVQKVEFPAMTIPAGQRAVLSFNARAVTPTYAGWNNLLSIQVNGNLLDAEDPDGKTRLLYRGSEIRTNANKKADWWHSNHHQALLLMFAPEKATVIDPAIATPRECGFDYFIDVTDLVNTAESKQNNSIEFKYLLNARGVKGREIPMLLRNLKIELMEESAVNQARPASNLVVLKTADAMPLSPAKFQIMNQNQPASQKVEFPAVKVPAGKHVILAFNARAVTPVFGGWSNNLRFSINGKLVKAADAAGKARLLFRSSELQNKENKKVSWWSARYSGWLLFYAPEKVSSLAPNVLSARECGFDYFIDVTDLVNTAESGQGNSLEFQYLLKSSDVKGRKIPLSVRNLRLEFLDEAETDKARQ